MSAKRVAVVSTHPIQYHSAWFQALAVSPELEICVYYCHMATPMEQACAGFGVQFDWDVPLLTGYPYCFLKNVADPPRHGSFAGFDTPEIKDIIRRRQYDAVLVNGWHYKSAWQAIWACWESGVKVLVRGDSHLHTPRGPLKKLAKLLIYRRFVPRLDACLAVGQWSRDYFLHYGASPERIFFVPNAVDSERIETERHRLEPIRSQLRRQWGLDEQALVFVFVGKFTHKKRPMDFVKAIDRAARQGALVQGLMVGDGQLRAICESFVREHDSPIGFAGFLNQSQIVSAYVASDVLVLPSDGGETWGLVVNEAMVCGRPCVVSDQVGCGPDLVQPGQTGATYPVGDVGALATLMMDFAKHPSLLASMAEQAPIIAKRYSTQAAVEGLIECLAAITDSPKSHSDAN